MKGPARFAAVGSSSRRGLTIVVALAEGVVAEPSTVLEERWSVVRAFADAQPRWAWRAVCSSLADRRDRRADVAPRPRPPVRGLAGRPGHGQATGDDEAVPMVMRQRAPVEFAPPEDMRPGQMGTLIDEQANILDVTATIVDLAVRGYLRSRRSRRKAGSGSPTGRYRSRRKTSC